MNDPGESEEDARSRRPSGCLTFVVVYGVSLVIMYWLSAGPEVTDDFSGNSAVQFRVAALESTTAPGSPGYLATTLAAIENGQIDVSAVSFLMPEASVLLPVGDVHRVNVLERHEDWQLIEYHYSNTHSSVSRYRAYADRVEPISYRVTSHVGQVMLAAILLLPAAIVSAIIVFAWRYIGARSKASQAV